MEVKGTIKRLFEAQQVTDSFKKRNLHLVTNENYPQILEIQFVQDKCILLDSVKEGDSVSISINLKGREWENPSEGQIKVFNTIEGWQIQKLS